MFRTCKNSLQFQLCCNGSEDCLEQHHWILANKYAPAIYKSGKHFQKYLWEIIFGLHVRIVYLPSHDETFNCNWGFYSAMQLSSLLFLNVVQCCKYCFTKGRDWGLWQGLSLSLWALTYFALAGKPAGNMFVNHVAVCLHSSSALLTI